MHSRNEAGGMVGTIPYESMGLYILYSTRMTCMLLQYSRSYIDCLAFELLKLRFREHNVFDGLFKIG